MSEKVLEEDGLVLAMSPRQVAELRRVFGDSFKVYILPKYVGVVSGEEEVPDPYGSTMTAHRASAPNSSST